MNMFDDMTCSNVVNNYSMPSYDGNSSKNSSLDISKAKMKLKTSLQGETKQIHLKPKQKQKLHRKQ